VAATTAQTKMIEAHVDFGSWVLGKPNRIVEFSTNAIEPQQKDFVKNTVIDPGLKSESWLRAIEYKPSDHRVVRAAFFKIQETGQWIGSWTPWYGFVSLPKGLSYRLPAGAHIAAQIYYRSAKEEVVEHGSLGLFFSDRPSEKNISDLVLESKSDTATDSDLQKFHAETKLAADTNVLALWPEIPQGMKSIEVSGRKLDGETQVLLFAKDFPVDWPTPYILKSPITLSKGTELFVNAYYANTGAAPPPSGIRLTVSEYQGASLPREKPAEVKTQQTPPPQRYRLAGTVLSVDAKANKLVVQHSAITGYMPAMTMGYDAGKQADLKSIASGDQIQADLVVVGTEMHLENIKVISHTK
jgi:Cu/Ag efflux protein CusF